MATASNRPRLQSSSSSSSCSLLPLSSECSYNSCFCEENVWLLCDHIRRNSSSSLSNVLVVFVSNAKQVVPLWRQRAGKDEERLVIWDYHVFLLYQDESEEHRCLVYDLDSELPFPTHFHKYVTETFRTDAILNPEYHRRFRLVPAQVFLDEFASDRRHMRKADGSWMKTPPDYPCIATKMCQHNLDAFISMSEDSEAPGQVMSLQEFVQRFYRPPTASKP